MQVVLLQVKSTALLTIEEGNSMPQGKGTYGTKVGRPPKKKKKVLRMDKGGASSKGGEDPSKHLISLKKSELIDIIMQSLNTGRRGSGKAVKDSKYTFKGMTKAK